MNFFAESPHFSWHTLPATCLRKPINEICETNFASFRIDFAWDFASFCFEVLSLDRGRDFFVFKKQFCSPVSSYILGSHSDSESPVLFGTSRAGNPWNIRAFGNWTLTTSRLSRKDQEADLPTRRWTICDKTMFFSYLKIYINKSYLIPLEFAISSK